MKFRQFNRSNKQNPVISVLMSLSMLFAAFSASADQLWSNGDTQGVTLGWGQYSSTMDDFYVPGGGWYINHAETIGIYVDPATVSDVEVAIWEHDNSQNEPNDSKVQVLNVTSFQAVQTGRVFLDREEIKISVDFDNTYLKGQRFYWIEFTVRDQNGIEDFRFLARNSISHEPAWTHFGAGSISPSSEVYGSDRDLSFSLHGYPVTVAIPTATDKITTEAGGHDRGVFTGIKRLKTRTTKTAQIKLGDTRDQRTINEFVFNPCPAGSVLTPFEMPVYDGNGLFVVDYETVWFCIPEDLEPAG